MEETKVYVVKREDGYHVIDDGVEGPVCKIIEDGRTIVLGKNSANRQYCAVKKADAGIEEFGQFPITVRTEPPRKVGTPSNKLPNAKLISYLPEDLQAEYAELIAKARAAKEADKKTPVRDLDKVRAKIEKLKAKLAELDALEAQYADTNTDAE